MTCKHENAEHMMPGDTTTPDWLIAPFVAQCEQLRCIDCGAWLSLGPSDDEPAEVQLEIRAADIAAGDFKLSAAVVADEQHCVHWYDNDGPCCRCGDNTEADEETYCQVGVLARAIVEHGKERTS